MVHRWTVKRLIVAFFYIYVLGPLCWQVDLLDFVSYFAEDRLYLVIAGHLSLLSSSSCVLIFLLLWRLRSSCRLDFKIVFICESLVWIDVLDLHGSFASLNSFSFGWYREVLSFFFFREPADPLDLFVVRRRGLAQMALLFWCGFNAGVHDCLKLPMT